MTLIELLREAENETSDDSLQMAYHDARKRLVKEFKRNGVDKPREFEVYGKNWGEPMRKVKEVRKPRTGRYRTLERINGGPFKE